MNQNQNPVVKLNFNDSYLAKFKEDNSIQDLLPYRVLDRMRIVHGTSKNELTDMGLGTVVSLPTKQVIAKKDEFFVGIPVFFFVEFIKRPDIKDTSGIQKFEKTFDPHNDIAKKALNPSTWNVKYGKDNEYTMNFIESLNFAIIIPRINNMLTVVPFMRAERSVGNTLISLLTLRKENNIHIPYWAQRVRFTSKKREKGPNIWFGLDVAIDTDQPCIEEKEIETYQKTHQGLKEEFAAKRISVVEDVEDISEAETNF